MSRKLIEDKPYISLADYARAMGISIKTAQQYVWAGKLKSVRVNNQHYVLESLIDPDVRQVRSVLTVSAKKIHRRDLIEKLYVAMVGGAFAGGRVMDREKFIEYAILSADILIEAMEESE